MSFPKLLIFLLTAAMFQARTLPAKIRLRPENLLQIAPLIQHEIALKHFPGAVVCIGQGDEIIYLQAFGNRIITPFTRKMTTETLFDLASLTKPIATAGSILLLRERHQLELDDPVGKYLPDFACKGKEKARISHLLKHTSGLPAYLSAKELKQKFGSPCPHKLISRICKLTALNPPGEKFRYSCLGYITLAKIVETVSGMSVDKFAQRNIFTPLRMSHTGYNPPSSCQENIAATEVINGQPLCGIVHDPLARLMGGVSGNAGLFSTAGDLSRYCRMLLNNGALGKTRIFRPETVQLLTGDQSQQRAYGFDVNSPYAWFKGTHAPKGTFCHSGYTGTSIVCDPGNKIFIIILTNRVHPHDKGSVKTVRTRIADIVFQE